jgi:hypothetical protein
MLAGLHSLRHSFRIGNRACFAKPLPFLSEARKLGHLDVVNGLFELGSLRDRLVGLGIAEASCLVEGGPPSVEEVLLNLRKMGSWSTADLFLRHCDWGLGGGLLGLQRDVAVTVFRGSH